MKCRLCVFECPDEGATVIFSENEQYNLTKLIVKYLYLEITQYDEFSTKICFDCKRHLQEFHEFFQKIEERQQQLKTDCVKQHNVLVFKENEPNHKNFEFIIEEPIIDIKNEETESETLPEEEEFVFLNDKSNISSSLSNVETMDPMEFFDKDNEEIKSEITTENIARSMVELNKIVSDEASTEEKPRKRNRKKVIKKEDERDVFIKENIELKCEICQEVSSTFKDLKAHFEKEHNKRAYITCCGFRFKDRWCLINHIRLHGTDKAQKAVQIIKLTPDEHKKRDDFIAKNIELKCEICGVVSLEFQEFKDHFRKEHNQPAYITCCGMRLSGRHSFYHHLNLHVNPDYLKCKFCGKQLKTLNNYKMHVLNYHGDEEEKKLGCEICHKRFGFGTMLRAHMISHKKELDQHCTVCGKSFKTLKSLKKHSEQHGERPKFVCHVCGKEKYSKQMLEWHLSGEHKIGTISTSKPKSSSNEKSKCSVCNKSISSSSMRFHMLSHDLKDMECKECGKIFKSKGSFLSHKYQAHKERKHCCTYCGKKFKAKQSLDVHIPTHTGRKDFICKYCKKGFSNRSNKSKHEKQMHPEEYAQDKALKTSEQS